MAKIERILYKEINDGDRKKFVAASNRNPDEGGGARDLRFSGFVELNEFLGAMFPGREPEERTRKGKKVTVDLLTAPLYWIGKDGQRKQKGAYFEPPTTARPNEWRLTKVHTFKCFASWRIPKGGTGNKVILMFVEEDGLVWPHFASEKDLRAGDWHDDVAAPILACIDAKRKSNLVVMGFVDYTKNGTRFCNGG